MANPGARAASRATQCLKDLRRGASGMAADFRADCLDVIDRMNPLRRDQRLQIVGRFERRRLPNLSRDMRVEIGHSMNVRKKSEK
jgi:hypothetical protein